MVNNFYDENYENALEEYWDTQRQIRVRHHIKDDEVILISYGALKTIPEDDFRKEYYYKRVHTLHGVFVAKQAEAIKEYPGKSIDIIELKKLRDKLLAHVEMDFDNEEIVRVKEDILEKITKTIDKYYPKYSLNDCALKARITYTRFARIARQNGLIPPRVTTADEKIQWFKKWHKEHPELPLSKLKWVFRLPKSRIVKMFEEGKFAWVNIHKEEDFAFIKDYWKYSKVRASFGIKDKKEIKKFTNEFEKIDDKTAVMKVAL